MVIYGQYNWGVFDLKVPHPLPHSPYDQGGLLEKRQNLGGKILSLRMKETVDHHALITWSGKLEEPTMELTLRSPYSSLLLYSILCLMLVLYGFHNQKGGRGGHSQRPQRDHNQQRVS